MATYTNKNGTNDNDVLTYNAKNTYHANGGNDTIKINGGSGIVVYTDKGNNTITVTGGSNHTIKVAANNGDSDQITGVEKLIINGANMIEGYLGSGKDEITLLYTDGKKISGALSQIHGGAWTDTFTIGNGAKGYQLYGDAGNDIFNISNGNNIICWGGAANDTFNVAGGTGIKLRGGDSADVYNISVAGVDMQLGYGNDEVNITAGDKQTIKANLGINTINLKAGSGHVITADIDQVASKKAGKDVGYGVDKVTIDGATKVTANLGDGKDVVEVWSGTDHKIYTEGWSDSLTVHNGVSQSLFDLGAGDDEVVLNGGSKNVYYGGSGKDVINVKIYGSGEKTEYNDIYLGADGDTFNTGAYETVNYNKISGGTGNDILFISSYYAKNNVLYGGSGDDELAVIYNSTNEGSNTYSTMFGGVGSDVIYCTSNYNLLIGGADADAYAIGAYDTNYIDIKTDNGSKIEDYIRIFGFTYMNSNASNITFNYDKVHDIMRIKCEYGKSQYVEGFSKLERLDVTNSSTPATSSPFLLGSGASIISKLTAAQMSYDYANVKSGYGVQDLEGLTSYTTMDQFFAKESDFKIAGNK